VTNQVTAIPASTVAVSLSRAVNLERTCKPKISSMTSTPRLRGRHDLAPADQLRTGSGSEGRITYFKCGYGWAHTRLEATRGRDLVRARLFRLAGMRLDAAESNVGVRKDGNGVADERRGRVPADAA